VELDGPGEGEVTVRVVAAGVCHTDLALVTGGLPMPMPAVLGHEGAGVIEEVGPGVSGLVPGDHVVLTVLAHCRQCAHCLAGRPYDCAVGLGATFAGQLVTGRRALSRDGALVNHFFGQSSFAQRVVVHEATAIKIDDDIDLGIACLLGCGASTGIGAVLNTGAVAPGGSVAVFGCGGVGLAAIMGAALLGANDVVAIDLRASRLAAAAKVGATQIIEAGGDVAERVLAAVPGGVDLAIDSVGHSAVVRQALSVCGPSGTALIVGAAPAGTTYELESRLFKPSRRVVGNVGGSIVPEVDIPRYARLFAAGRLPLRELVTAELGLDDVPEALRRLQNGDGIRSVIHLDGA